MRTLRLLAEIYDATSGVDRLSLVRRRQQIRQIESYDSRNVLTLVVKRTKDPHLRLLAIWLRGRCGGTIGTATVADYCSDADFQVRKVVARALQRMSAWSDLRAMAAKDPSDRIRRIATVRSPGPFAERLSSLLEHIPPDRTVPVRRNLFIGPSFSLTQGRPPKSAATIRAILERIQRLLTVRE